jgi:hypothetical protein
MNILTVGSNVIYSSKLWGRYVVEVMKHSYFLLPAYWSSGVSSSLSSFKSLKTRVNRSHSNSLLKRKKILNNPSSTFIVDAKFFVQKQDNRILICLDDYKTFSLWRGVFTENFKLNRAQFTTCEYVMLLNFRFRYSCISPSYVNFMKNLITYVPDSMGCVPLWPGFRFGLRHFGPDTLDWDLLDWDILDRDTLARDTLDQGTTEDSLWPDSLWTELLTLKYILMSK